MIRVTTYAQVQGFKSNVLGLQTRLDQLNDQVSSGKKSTRYGGLAAESRISLDLRARLQAREAYTTTISVTRLRLETSESALKEVESIAQEVRRTILTLKNGGRPDASLVNTVAQGGIDRIAALLNTNVQGRYLFAGTEITTVPMADRAPIQGVIQGNVTGYTDGTAAGIRDTVRAYFDDTTNWSQLDPAVTGRLTARIDEGLDLDYTARADRSAIGDILSGLYVAATTSYTSPAEEQGFWTLMDGAAEDLLTGAQATNGWLGELGTTLARLDETEALLDAQEVIFTRQLRSVEDVDPAAAIADLNQTQALLQATYNVIASTRSLSLAQYL